MWERFQRYMNQPADIGNLAIMWAVFMLVVVCGFVFLA